MLAWCFCGLAVSKCAGWPCVTLLFYLVHCCWLAVCIVLVWPCELLFVDSAFICWLTVCIVVGWHLICCLLASVLFWVCSVQFLLFCHVYC